MNRFKEVRPIVFLTCLLLGIALLSIYSFASEFIILKDASTGKISNLFKSIKNNTVQAPETVALDDGVLSVGELSKHRIDVSEEERRSLFMDDGGTLYTASRGDVSRTAEDVQTGQAENAQPAPAAANPAETKPAATTAAKPAATAQAKAAVKPAPQPTPAPKAAVKSAPQAAPAPKAASADTGYADELDLLARLITAEAQAEPYEAQVAVGAVVINRVQSGVWASTIKGVIYQNINGYYQFTPVQNGWINKPAQPEAVKAAKAALSGADPTNGAQFYYDDKVTNQWILSKPVSVKIGHMTFAF